MNFLLGFGSRPRRADGVVIVIADGPSNVNFQDTIPAAENLKSQGYKMMGIAVGMKDFTEINAIASSKSDVYKVRTIFPH